MFAFIGTIVNSLIGGILSPIMTYLNKKQDVGLEEFKASTQQEQADYLAYVTAVQQANQTKVAANNWWGAHVMIYMFGLPAALHWTAVFWVSTFQLSWFGLHSIPAVPPQYAQAELTIALSFFILAPTLPIVSSVANMLYRRS